MGLEVDFLRDYIKNVVECSKPVDIKTLIYRGNGEVELSPGNNIPALIPDRLLDHTRQVVIHNAGQKVNTPSGEGQVAEDFEGEITIKGVLKEGDPVVVARYTGINKYVVLERIDA